MQNHTNASPTIYNQVRNVLLLGIVSAVYDGINAFAFGL